MESGVRGVIAVGVVLALIGGKVYLRSQRPPSRADVVQVEQDDPEMREAIAEARSKWGQFTAAFAEHKPGRICMVKAPFKVKGSHAEHMWVKVSAINGQTISGTLENDPMEGGKYKLGDNVSVKVSDVEDWAYNDGETLIGNFSERVLDGARKR